MHIREYLRSHRLITDGAMGTYYEEKYGKDHGIAERENCEHPKRIKEIHLEYLRSGARLLRTNSFACNSMFYSDKAKLEQSLRSAYEIAQSAREEFLRENPEEQVYVAADIGTIIDPEHMDYENVLAEYQWICDVFLDCGADVFLFETQAELNYLVPVSEYVKEKTDAYIIAQFSFDKNGYTRAGIRLEKLLSDIAGVSTIDAYGLNCGVEATHMYRLLKKQKFPENCILTALPNAGYPYAIRGQLIYSHNIPYYVEEMKKIVGLGVDIIGGCCGTTPEYIAALTKELAEEPLHKKKIGTLETVAQGELQSAFMEKLVSGEKPFVVELDPPFTTDITKVMQGAGELAEAGVDLITLSDSPMARVRMDAGQLAAKIQQEVGVSVMPHICCRDKNVLALRSGLLGNYMNDIRHFLVVTGDPVARGDRDHITSVFDFNSIKLMNYIRQMNEDVFAAEPVIYGGALNYHGANPDAIIRRMEQKKENGCRYFLTQPIYTVEDVERIRYIKARMDTKILCGIMPLVNYKNAMFVKNEMPGIYITDEIVNCYHPDMSREEAEDVAIRLSVETAKELKDVADGYYFMTPFNRTGLIARIMKAIREGLE